MQNADLPTECDIVMKGGITSGVVYPAAIVALSAKFRFRNIGGTSAGAIAAALTAAAEYCRQTGKGDAFKTLRLLPSWLASDGHLLKLFRPNRRTRAAFEFLMQVLDSPKDRSKVRAVFQALPACHPQVAVPGALLGLALIVMGIASHRWWLVPVGVFLATTLPFAVPGWLLYRCLADEVPRNFYGLCTGLSDGNLNDPTVLTSWLASLIDDVSGVDDGPKPLTFGDLWRGGAAEVSPAAQPASDARISAQAADAERSARSINLEMITTNLTHGRPYKFPFDTNIFYFHPEEFGKLFPPRVVKWMLQHARKPSGEEEAARMQSALPLVPLPQAQDIPIVVAARMSLSFPLLISAVPLWAVDWTLRYNRQHRTAPKFERCWFSDGGLSSNFPVHLFDSPIPLRPTFGIDLDSFTPDYPESDDESANVWMPETNSGGIDERWTRFDESKPNLGGFFGAIFCTMQNWQDNMQSRVPGFRDRIAHVNLSAQEGGLNVNMKPEVLNKLAKRGFYAGQLLMQHFEAPDPQTCGSDVRQPMNWDNHRVVRYRNAMSLLENWVRRFSKHFTPEYSALVNRPLDAPPCSYPWQDENQRAFAQTATSGLVDLNAQWEASGESFAPGAPRPQPDLATRPRV